MTISMFVMLMTLGVGVGSLIIFLLCIIGGGQLPVRHLFWIWVAIWFVLSALICLWAYREIYASTLEMWPKGYPNRGL
jgi:hypothetical protein